MNENSNKTKEELKATLEELRKKLESVKGTRNSLLKEKASSVIPQKLIEKIEEAEIIPPEKPIEVKKGANEKELNQYESKKTEIEKRKKEAKELHDNSVLTAGDNGFVIKKSKHSYEIAKDLRTFIQKQPTVDQLGVIYKFKDGDNIYNYAISTYDNKRGAGIGYVGYSVKVDKNTSLTDKEIYAILENNLEAAFDQNFINKNNWQTDNDKYIHSVEKNNFDKINAKYEAELVELDRQFKKDNKQSENKTEIFEIKKSIEETEESTEEDDKSLDNLLENIQKIQERTKERGEKIKKLKDELKKESEENKIEDKEGNDTQNIPIATEIFKEKRSIKDESGKEITVGDIVTKENKRDYFVVGFSERKIEEKYLKPGQEKNSVIYANLVEYKDGEVNFSTSTSGEDGKIKLKEKWQPPKYDNGEIIKLGDLVEAKVEKYVFELYNKTLRVRIFNMNGKVALENLDGTPSMAVTPKLLIKKSEENKNENKEGLKKFYMEAPREIETKNEYEKYPNSYFDMRGETSIQIPNQSVFEFIETGPDTAEFKLINDPTIIKRAINLYYRILKPICENKSGKYTEDAKEISFIQDTGIVKKEGDKWVVVEPLIIKEFVK
jgi:hypothetical protein